MSFTAAVKGLERLPAAIEKQKRRSHKAVASGIKRGFVEPVKDRARAAARKAFPKRGFRIANTIRGTLIDKGPGRRVVGLVRTTWRIRRRGGRFVDPIAARIYGTDITPHSGGYLAIRNKKSARQPSIRDARRLQKTYFVKVRPGVIVLIGRGKTGRAKPKILFTLVKRVAVRRVSSPRRLLGNSRRTIPVKMRQALV
jgi:hypothetical protein